MAFCVYFSGTTFPQCSLNRQRNGLISPEVDQSGGEDPSGHAVHAVKRDDGQHRGMECTARPVSIPMEPARGTPPK